VSIWWKDLKEVWVSENWERRFEDCFKWKIGNGKLISFWEDNWTRCGDLKSVFPRLCFLSIPFRSKLAEFGNWVEGVWEWKLAWRRNLFKWEKVLESQFLQELQGLRLKLDLDDGWVWKDKEFYSYSVNFTYVFLRGEPEGESILCM